VKKPFKPRPKIKGGKTLPGNSSLSGKCTGGGLFARAILKARPSLKNSWLGTRGPGLPRNLRPVFATTSPEIPGGEGNSFPLVSPLEPEFFWEENRKIKE